MPRAFRFNLLVLGTVSLLMAACQGGGSASAPPGGAASVAASLPEASATPAPSLGGASAGAAGTVEITLQEWAVVTSSASAPAGDVNFTVTNDGPEDVHEFVVLRTDLDPAELPTDETGAIDEEGEGIEVVDEIEDIPVGETRDLAVTLEPGSYALVCNVYSDDEDEAHYEMGMYTAFTAEE